ncbi:hypothetical protein C8Q74DRAFT_1217922 [Fomes fomentarius]|nr:hypothetical protein C8Q74DRAFT_1217922 [Fomes fomentarius]
MADILASSANILNVFNDDVLFTLFEYLRGTRGLLKLADTCLRFRNTLKPMLFTKCYIHRSKFTYIVLPPSTIWPYIRILSVACTFRLLRGRKTHDMAEFEYVYEPLMNTLSLIPNLVSIELNARQSIDRDGSCDVDIPWEVVKAMLTPPQLRHFRFSGRFDDSIVLPNQNELLPWLPVAPLKSYTRVIDYRKTFGPTSLEIYFVSSLAERPEVHESLETLILPNEGVLVPWMAYLCHMPQLASLTLDFAYPDSVPKRPIWPHDTEFMCAWQNLEPLSITYPHSEDELYAHLPPSLRQLSLRCWPRHYVHLTPEEQKKIKRLRWYSPISTSSEMLKVLRACKLTLLEQLDIEFKEDLGDGSLFRSLPTLFPNLTVLTIHRYRSRSSEVVPVAFISEALSPLCKLRVLKLHLDFPNAPPVRFFVLSPPAQVIDILQQAADYFACNLAPGVGRVCFLLRRHHMSEFRPYRVVRNGNTPRAEYDSHARAAGGFPISDDSGPPVVRHYRRTDEIDYFMLMLRSEPYLCMLSEDCWKLELDKRRLEKVLGIL